MILRRQGFSYYAAQKQMYIEGILFDGAWLWEEYVWRVLLYRGKNSGLLHPDNVEKKGCIHPFEKRKPNNLVFYPDFYKDDVIVLDAKYKHHKKPDSNDIHQVLSYMLITNAQRGVLVYPNNESDSIEICEYKIRKSDKIFVELGFPCHYDPDDRNKFKSQMQGRINDFRTKLQTLYEIPNNSA